MHVLIVYNQTAGYWNNERTALYLRKKLIKKKHKVKLFQIVDWSGDIYEKFGDKKYNQVIAIGGDGTVRTCATLIMNHIKEAKLCIVPAGSSNVLATAIGVGNSPTRMIRKIAKQKKLKEKRIDTMLLNNKIIFLDSLMLGYLPQVINNTSQKLKNRLGFLAYIVYFFKRRKPEIYNFSIIIDGKEYQLESSTIIVSNALSILGFKPRTVSDYSDGKIELFYMDYTNLWQFIKNTFFLFSSKKIPYLQGKTIDIIQKKDRLSDAHIDGDFLKPAETYTIKVVPKSLSVLI